MRRLPGRVMLAAAVALTAAGCNEVTAFPEEGVTVRAAHGLPAVRSAAVDFSASVAIDNFSARMLFVDPDCGWVIERFVGAGWEVAYTAPCLGSISEIAIAPRSTTVFTVLALTSHKVDPTDPPEGDYRIKVALEAEYSRLRRQEVPEEQRTSNLFVVP